MGQRRFGGKLYTPGTVRHTSLFIATTTDAVVQSCFWKGAYGALPPLLYCGVCRAQTVPNKPGISGILLAYVFIRFVKLQT
jgi:hypothetical protein